MSFSLISEAKFANYKGILIEVESTLLISGLKGLFEGVVQHQLIINHAKVDQITSHLGKSKLRGYISLDEHIREPVIVIICQGFFRTKYELKIGDIKYELKTLT